MMFKDVNFKNISSELVDQLHYDHEAEFNECKISIQINQNILHDFNERNINPSNINEILTFCDYLLIKDTLKFIVKHSTPTLIPYILNDTHKLNYTLPKFMIEFCNDPIYCGAVQWLQFAFENGMTHDDTCIEAAKGGYLDCLKYACEHNYYWDNFTCAEAADHGHLGCLKYAHENGC